MESSMKIVVLIKQVSDTWGERHLDAVTGLQRRADSDQVVDEISAVALETALQLREAHGGTVTVLSMGGGKTSDALRKMLAMGADDAVLVMDDRLVGADARQSALALAAAVKIIGCDLVLTGNESTDGRTAALPAMLAELLDLPQLTNLRSIEVSGGRIQGERASGSGILTLIADLPALASVVETVAEPRFPGLRGTLAAKKKPMRTLSLADLGALAEGEPLLAFASLETRPPRTGGRTITDDGTVGRQVLEFLTAQRLI
jgi:electron transfer flavoprotein beta subunit